MIGDGGPITDLAIRRVVLITMMANKTVATIASAFTLVMGALGAAGRGSFMPQELGGPWISLPPQNAAVPDRQPRIGNRRESAPRQQCNRARPLFRNKVSNRYSDLKGLRQPSRPASSRKSESDRRSDAGDGRRRDSDGYG